MAITIGGVKLNRVHFDKDDSTGKLKMTGNYALESNTGIVLAKQSFNGYQDVEVKQSQETSRLIQDLMNSIQTDVQNTLGFN